MRLHFERTERARWRAAACLLVAVGMFSFASAACSSSSGDDGSGASADGTTPGDTSGAPGTTSANTTDGKKDGTESDVDCGGANAPKCADGKACATGTDCESGSCKAGVCAAPAPDDGVKNADETDVDCGGTKAPKCAVGKACVAHDDCDSAACDYTKKCVEYKSCTAHAGGDTCGAGETGDPAAQHESCCTTVKITDKPSGAFEIDKYQLTAGRMRAFVERYDGNLQAWAAKDAPASWNAAWTKNLPASMSDALYMLGPGGKRGCNVVNQGGRTYWQDPIDGNAQEKSDFTRDVLDEKSLNCVTWYMAQAACAFDGKRLATNAEIQWVFENRGRAGGPTQYPWQFKDNVSYNASQADMHLVHVYSYATPNPPASMRLVGSGANAYPLDHAFYIAPPGRRPDGADMYGVEDAAGNMLMWVDDGPKDFTWTMSWENHPKNLTVTTWNASDGPDGYYALGARCAK